MKHATLICLTMLLAAGCANNKAPKAQAVEVSKPAVVTREEWGSKPMPIDDSHRQVPKYITIHHGGVDWKPGTDPVKFVRSIQSWGQHRVEENNKLPENQRKPNVENWPDLPYHFMIAPDGRIFEARPIQYEPQSNTNYPLQGHVGVELMGNFEDQRPSEQQLKSTVALVAWLCQAYNIDPSQIAGHRDRAEKQTVCPGKDFYRYLKDGEFVGWVKETLAGGNPNVKPGPALASGPTTQISTAVNKAADDEKDDKPEKK